MSFSPSIYIDESGDIGLNKSRDRFYTVAYVYTFRPALIRKKLSDLLILVQDREKYPLSMKEFKFFLPKNKLRQEGYDDEKISDFEIQMQEIRIKVLQIVEANAEGIFVAILDKESKQYDTWTSERIGNYVIGHTLAKDILNLPSIRSSPSIYYDDGRLSIKQTKKFESYLEYKYMELGLFTKFGCPLNYSGLNSVSEPLIWAADIVAGTYYCHFKYANNFYSKMLTKKLGIGFKKYW